MLANLLPIGYQDVPPELRSLVDKIGENFRILEILLNSVGIDKFQQNIALDEKGINPQFMKFYPNKCWNSSFEIYDADLKPLYWDTDGVVDSTEFDNTVGLKLTTGQYAEQVEVSGEGFANPNWWDWSPDTRISFRAKSPLGTTVQVEVFQGVTAKPLWTEVKDPITGKYSKKTGTSLEFSSKADWAGADEESSLITFCVTPTLASGKIKLRIENTGATNPVWIDAIIIEPDWNKRWPSYYEHGPQSVISIGDECVEYGAASWNAAGVTFTLVNAYDDEPVVTVGVQGSDPTEFASASFSLVIKHVKETVGGVSRYSKVMVYPKGTSLPTPTDGKITMVAICTGMVFR